MKCIYQIALIFGFSFLGELLNRLIPLPIPASIYGMALLFAALSLKLVRIEMVRDAGHFLVGIISLLFVAPTVGLIDCWELIAPQILQILLVILASTFITFAVAGIVTQAVMNKKKGAKADA